MILDRHDLKHTTKTVLTPCHRHPSRPNVGVEPLGSKHEARYYPTCSCGWVGPVAREFDRMIDDHAKHKQEEAA